MLRTFGIRHHGPGSAKLLLQALQQMQPDCLLIEAPADVEKVLEYAADKALVPPVALLVYNHKQLKQAAYVPFAKFSPEWQAIQYALKHEIPIRAIDLPMSISFALSTNNTPQTQLELPVALTSDEEIFQKDPIGYMARLAGYQDSERWWEKTFEQTEHSEEVFDLIMEMMTALRTAMRVEKPENLRREAYMRKCLRKAQKDGFQRIAVVCGAWHAPVLQAVHTYKTSSDNAILRGLKKVPTKATWIPWTYDRLTFHSGYGAGIHAPAWYALLFSKRKEATIRWMVKVARLFRKEAIDASSAHVIEATRLATTLAALRELSVPGIQEMEEAAIAVFCEGVPEKMQLIRQQLIIGDVMGKVPAHIPTVPLQQDLEKKIKSARLSAYRQTTEERWLKATANQPRGGLDLRNKADRLKSQLLHRLAILNIHWGRCMNQTGREQGTYHEYWKLKWRADFAIRIIEAGMWGNTVEEAAGRWLVKTAQEEKSLSALTVLLQQALQADLPNAIDPLVIALTQQSALTTDVLLLMETLPALITVVRFGDVRQTDISAVTDILEAIVPRICIGLPATCQQLDEENAEQIFDLLLRVNHAINQSNDEDYLQNWLDSLQKISELPHTHYLLRGAATRLLLDKNRIDLAAASRAIHFALSAGNAPLLSARWLEGFLHGSGLMLVLLPTLWQLIDDWVSNLDDTHFQQVLPLLRRTFSTFSIAERKKIMTLAKQDTTATATTEVDIEIAERAQKVIPVVLQLLGYEE